MIRALVAGVLFALVAIHFGAPPDGALGISVPLCFALWLTWPLLERLARAMRRIRRAIAPRRAGRAPRPAAAAPVVRAQQQAQPQVVHNYYFFGVDPAHPAPDLNRLALPHIRPQQAVHDSFYGNVIDAD
ncbi:hypothetical protein QDT91_28715 (plasmid) [Mycolicibacterium aubagnense]|jgi:xanthosine utilization system XapX-like protein|uniref:hypothetical protein n=1 Tax=Mycolicibacterium aubagnense TaxID=319707 RepID=UPI001ACF00D5|nr:hypothetical protein [Mycolicibacterium aubagnense]MBN9636224.1 hypothetical protein [Actinomycetota bacterium]WGI35991.1 hypothetical protein QDT91_28715 [Mycolicibacterium aubagnense]